MGSFVLKHVLKRGAASLLSVVGHSLSRPAQREWLCRHLVPMVLDPAVLSRDVSVRTLKTGRVPVLCSPYAWTHRAVYWCGCLSESALEKYFSATLRPGDSYIDVGCNYGHLCMLASHCVGEDGCVLAFEANPGLAEILSAHIDDHAVTNVTVYPFGLSDVAGDFALRVNPKQLGLSTLRQVPTTERGSGQFTETVNCELRTGDNVLMHKAPPGRALLKVDVEGHELQVLRGMSATLSRRVHCAIVEISPRWLGERDGVREIFEFMSDRGFNAYKLTDAGTAGDRLAPEAVATQANVLFLRRQDDGGDAWA